MLETSAFQIFLGGNSTFINSFDKTKFLFLTLKMRSIGNSQMICHLVINPVQKEIDMAKIALS